MLLNEPQARANAGSTVFLDGCRGLAAFYVLIHHARALLHEGYAQGYALHPQAYSALSKIIFYLLTVFRAGHEMVIFFFVLSGFVIHLRYARQMQRGESRLQWADYVWRRIRRLYPPLLLALAITFALDTLGSHQGWSIYSSQTIYREINKTIHPNHELKTLLGNLTFLMDQWQKVYVPVYGANGPLWSLRFEWWFYMLYPVFWWLTRESKLVAAGTMTLLYGLSFFTGFWPLLLLRDIFQMMLIWWMGATLADIHAGRIALQWKYLIPLVICPAGTLLHVPEAVGSVLWGLGFSGVIATGFAVQQMGWKLRILEKLQFLGNMSYSLYVMHMPMLVFMSGWLMYHSGDGHLPQTFLPLLVGCSLVLVVTYLAHLVVEQPFIRSHKPNAASPALAVASSA